MLVIADASPLHYLVLIEQVALLHTLFGHIIVPQGVVDELQHHRTPSSVRSWMAAPPVWLEVRRVEVAPEAALLRLGAGEREASVLAEDLGAELLLMDDQAGRHEAERRSLAVIGTLRVVELGAERNLLDLEAALTRLQAARFYLTPEMVQGLLAREAERKRKA